MLKPYDEYICHFKYFLPRFQNSSCSDRILSDSGVLRTHCVPGWVTGHGETGPSEHPHTLVTEADGGCRLRPLPSAAAGQVFYYFPLSLGTKFESINSLALNLLYGPTSIHVWTRE